jgi:glucose dehydrogenase
MTTNDKALFSSSTVAIDVDTGQLKWYFQHAPAVLQRDRNPL